MKAKIITSGVLLLSVIAFSCKKEKTWVYGGPSLIEFSNPPSNAYTKTIYATNVPVLDSSIIQLVGPHAATDIKVGWDTVNVTAAIPSQIELLTTYGTASIPAKSSHSKVAFTLFPTAVGKKMGFVLKDGGDLKINPIGRSLALTVAATPIDWAVLHNNDKPSTGAINDTMKVRITAAGARFGKALTFNYTVKATSTAVEGTDYTFITPKGKVEFAPMKGEGIVVVKFNPATTTKKLELVLTSEQGVTAAASRNTFVLTVKP